MKEIPLTQGKVALVDDADFAELSKYKWQFHQGYAIRQVPFGRGKPNAAVLMHRQLMPGIKQIDHADGNGLNNCRSNLRSATRAQNNANQKKTRGMSRYKGVCWWRRDGTWRARIKHRGKGIHIGYFRDEIDAARAYNEAAKRLFGEFARPNTIPGE